MKLYALVNEVIILFFSEFYGFSGGIGSAGTLNRICVMVLVATAAHCHSSLQYEIEWTTQEFGSLRVLTGGEHILPMLEHFQQEWIF